MSVLKACVNASIRLGKSDVTSIAECKPQVQQTEVKRATGGRRLTSLGTLAQAFHFLLVDFDLSLFFQTVAQVLDV